MAGERHGYGMGTACYVGIGLKNVVLPSTEDQSARSGRWTNAFCCSHRAVSDLVLDRWSLAWSDGDVSDKHELGTLIKVERDLTHV